MSKKLQLLCVAILSTVLLRGQSTDHSHSTLSATEPPSQQWNDWFNQEVEKFAKNLQTGTGSNVTYQIPVVFHVINFGEAVGTFPNIDSNQIKSQVAILNADYAGVGLNSNHVPPAFANLVCNTGISFCLAKKDQNGITLVERGIHRVNASAQGWANPTTAGLNMVTYMNTVIKPNTYWDPTKYLNIWVSDKPTAQSYLGFATWPAGTTLVGVPNSGVGTVTTDGVWCWAKTIGNVGTVIAPHNKGRTLTKEVAHWLGVRNIWGDGNCMDDYCDDTPWAKQPNTGYPPYPSYINRCGIGQSPYGEMTMNFLDETDDTCRYMFTIRQGLRMQTAMSQCVYRNLLGTHGLCSTVTPAPAQAVAGFYFNGNICVGRPLTPVNTSTGGDPPVFQWSSSPSSNIYPSPQVASPAITFNTPGTYTIYLTAQNNLNIATFSMAVNAVTCAAEPLCLDTIRIIKNVDTLTTYKAVNNSSILSCQNGFAGFLTGTNCYGDKEFAQFYPALSYSAFTLPQVNSVIVLFDSVGTRATPATQGTQISCILYSGTAANGPNSQLAAKSDSLGRIVKSLKTNNVKYVGTPTYSFTSSTRIIPYKYDFAAPVILSPNTAGFFASIQMPFNSPTDSVRIMSNTKTNLTNDSSSWVLQNPTNNWRTLRNSKSAKIQLAILPIMTCRPVVGIKENVTEFNSNIAVMPNPSSGQFSLIFTLPKEQSLYIRSYNAVGQQIGLEHLDNVSNTIINMNLSDRPDGIYFIEISNGSERVVQKIIVNH